MGIFCQNYSSKSRLDEKIVVITGARVILACRDLNKAKEAVNDIETSSPRIDEGSSNNKPGQLAICQLNLSSLKSVKKCAQHLLKTEPAIHILINNAGVWFHPFEKTEDGFETHFQVNYLGHFLLTLLLLPKIRESGPGCRIINVSSYAYKNGDINFEQLSVESNYSPFKAYCSSKLAIILFTKELDNKLKTAGIRNINLYTLHPGVVTTDSDRYIENVLVRGMLSLMKTISPFVKTTKQGAYTTIYCAVDEKTANESGLYYDNCKVAGVSQYANDPEKAKQLWKYSCEVLNLPPDAEFEELLTIVNREALRE